MRCPRGGQSSAPGNWVLIMVDMGECTDRVVTKGGHPTTSPSSSCITPVKYIKSLSRYRCHCTATARCGRTRACAQCGTAACASARTMKCPSLGSWQKLLSLKWPAISQVNAHGCHSSNIILCQTDGMMTDRLLVEPYTIERSNIQILSKQQVQIFIAAYTLYPYTSRTKIPSQS